MKAEAEFATLSIFSALAFVRWGFDVIPQTW